MALRVISRVKTLNLFKKSRFISLYSDVNYYSQNLLNAAIPAGNEYRTIPNYPPIYSMEKEDVKRRLRQAWYDSIQAMPSVEAKLYEISSNQKITERVYLLHSKAYTMSSSILFQKYCSRTHIIQGLPEKITSINADDIYNRIKSHLCDTVATSFQGANRQFYILRDNIQEEFTTWRVLNALLSTCAMALSAEKKYLLEACYDHFPRVESYWWHGNFLQRRKRESNNLCFQYSDRPCLHVRIKEPLPAIVPKDDPLCMSSDVVKYDYHPQVLGIPYQRRHIASVPGFWPGDSCEYPLLSLHTSGRLDQWKKIFQDKDLKEFEDGFGIMSSFGWLMGIATHQGFTAFHELTYPLVTQAILTNGQDWNFFVYQLNTICLHSDVDVKTHRNLCWSSEKMRLFDTVEDGQLKGLNDDVLKTLLKFLLNEPKVSEGVQLKPYVSADTRSEEEIKNTRTELRKLFSNRPDPNRHKYEIPLWQYIYKRHPDAAPAPWLREY